MIKTRDYAGIDFFRIAAALLIVAIHTSPLTCVSPTADFILTRILARVAVPFFFMTTGFFVLLRPERITVYQKKTAILYGASILLYLPVNMYAGYFSGTQTAAVIIKDVLFSGTLYHLWYLPAALLGVCVTAALLQMCMLKVCLAVSGCLYIIGLFGDSYYGFTSAVPALEQAYEVMFRCFDYTRNGLFYAPIFLLMGAALRGTGIEKGVFKDAVGLFVSLALMVVEGLILRHFKLQRHDSMYLLLPVVMWYLFRLLLRLRGESRREIGTVALLTYILHPLMIILVRGAARYLGLWRLLVENSVVHYAAVCIASLAASVVIALIWNIAKPVRTSDKGRAWAEIDLSALRHNADTLKGVTPTGCSLMAVIKADAYGHGAVRVARELNRAGVNNFAVATAAEGAELRRHRIRGCILVLGYTHPSDFGCLTRYRLTQTVLDYEYAGALAANRRRIDVHIKLDTGMHRIGEDCSHIKAIKSIFDCRWLHVTGMYTHLCVADCLNAEDIELTRGQIKKFYDAIDKLRALGCDPGQLHIQSSYGLLNYPELSCDLARIGIAMYGVKSSAKGSPLSWPYFKPVLSVRARVAQTRTVHAGEAVGYGRGFIAERETRLAVLAIGYADGIPRDMGRTGGVVLIKGRRVPIIGKICMDQLMVDVTGLEDVQAGDIATIIGHDGKDSISCEEAADACGTISNELLSRLGPRLPRIYHR